MLNYQYFFSKLIDKVLSNVDKLEYNLHKIQKKLVLEERIDIKTFIKLSKLEIKLHICQDIMNRIRDSITNKIKIT